MKALRLIPLLLAVPPAVLMTAAARAQTSFPVTPTTPQSFKFKPVGQSATAGATVSPSPAPAVKQTTYLTLGQVRQWKSADGNSRIGQLIAWEQSVVTVRVPAGSTPAGAAAAANPAPPPVSGKPTIVRDGRIRLLIERKPYEIPLDRLGPDERKYIQDFQTSLAGKP